MDPSVASAADMQKGQALANGSASKQDNSVQKPQPTNDYNQFPDKESDQSSSELEQSEEEETDHYIYAEYVRVNRTRVRFKCDFRNAFILINGKEYVAKSLSGDFQY